jgi:threonine dehydrogenase-like Zn-dependent dehydrogenase
MKAVVFHGVGDIRVDDVAEPKVEAPTDAVVRVTSSAICGTDLHMVRGTLPDMVPGTILGHEGVGIVEDVGPGVRNFRKGDRVVIPSTIACGTCVYCRAGYYSQCDNANPNGKRAGTAFFGGPKSTGPFHGLQAEYARIPYGNVNMVRLPAEISDEQAILLSDIFPTGWFGARLAEIKHGDIVAVFGCGPVGQFAIASALLQGAGRVLAVDTVPARLDMARAQGAEVIDFNQEDPVEAVLAMTGGIGVDRAIDAVGVDAEPPHGGPAAQHLSGNGQHFARELEEDAPQRSADWPAGGAPSLALNWAVDSLDKAGTLAVIGVYPPTHRAFPIGLAMNRNLTIKTGNCNHRKYIPELIGVVESDWLDPSKILTQVETIGSALDAYHAFSRHESGWTKVELVPH